MPEPNSGCYLWLGPLTGSGYGDFYWKGLRSGAHRVAIEVFTGRPIPDGMCVCHRCDNPGCVNPGHLFLGTNDDNVADKVAKGRSSRGASHGLRMKGSALFQGAMAARRGENSESAKLSEDQARAIFQASGFQKDIAEQFGVTQSLVSSIKRKRIWEVLHEPGKITIMREPPPGQRPSVPADKARDICAATGSLSAIAKRFSVSKSYAGKLRSRHRLAEQVSLTLEVSK